MKRTASALRILLLAAGAVALPCCTTDVGSNPELSRVTVRVSVLPFGQEANNESLNAAISADGRYVAFESTATNLTPGDSNTLRDIFVKDRLTGEIENLTNLISGEFGPFPEHNFNPAISGNGRYVAFESRGAYVFAGFGPLTRKLVWVYDRVTRAFQGCVDDLFSPPDQECLAPSLSYDGRYVAWRSTASNLQSRVTGGTAYANGGNVSQVYVTDLTFPAVGPIVRLVSHASGSISTIGDGFSTTPRISADGNFVAYASQSTNLGDPLDSDPDGDVYVCTLTSALLPNEVVNIGFNPTSMMTEKGTSFGFPALAMSPAISADGRYVAFSSGADNWGFTPNLYIARRDRTAGLIEMAAPDAGTINPIIFGTDRIGLSLDGQVVAYMSDTVQMAVRNVATGAVEMVSINVTGQGANRQPFSPALSGDGRWAAWHTLAENLVASDINGVNDIFVRGPLQ